MTLTAPTRPSTVTLDADSADTAYRALADVTVAVTVDDDDAAGLVLNKTSMTIDEDGSGTFTVALATQATATVTVDVTSGDVAAATSSPQTLTFTTANWNTAQTVTVNGVDDADGTDETLDGHPRRGLRRHRLQGARRRDRRRDRRRRRRGGPGTQQDVDDHRRGRVGHVHSGARHPSPPRR